MTEKQWMQLAVKLGEAGLALPLSGWLLEGSDPRWVGFLDALSHYKQAIAKAEGK